MRILFFAAHPDDLDFYCVGVIRKLINLGAEIYQIYATKGGKGHPNPNYHGERLRKIRVREAHAAAKILGIKKNNVKFLDFYDADIKNKYNSKSISIFENLIVSLKPEVIFCPEAFSKYSWYKHPDHIYVGKMVLEACKRLDYKPILYFYHSIKNNTHFDVTGYLIEDSQFIHQSQYYMAPTKFVENIQFPGLKLSIYFVKLLKRIWGFMRCVKYVTPFRKVNYSSSS